MGWRTRQKVQASMAWPYVPGRVTASTLRESVTPGDAEHSNTVSYFPSIQYEYAVNAQTYQSHRMAFQEKSYRSRRKALEALKAYPPGQPVWVFFDPADPRSAVLDRQAHGNNIALILGPLLLLASVVALVKR
jgi:hypothetical protein